MFELRYLKFNGFEYIFKPCLELILEPMYK